MQRSTDPAAYMKAAGLSPSDDIVAFHGALPQTFQVYNVQWRLDLSPSEGWVPFWRDPCIVAVVVGAFVIALLQLRLTLSQERHAVLLQEMLPKKAITHLQQGRTTFVEQFDW